jgi:phosphonopyruvate decarboxylase
MIAADDFLAPARALGFDFYSGVPCSFLAPLINRVISDPKLHYVGATSEGEALAIAAGAWLAGRKSVVMCQNSGLGNCVNPLTSLNWPFRIPTLLIVTWRGQPGLEDEPQHELMGQITAELLDVMRLPHAPFPSDESGVAEVLEKADKSMAESGLPFALIMAKGAVGTEALDPPPPPPPSPAGDFEDRSSGGQRPARAQVLQNLLAVAPVDAAIIATTGKTGRELFTLADRRQQLYQVGSMGCAGAMGLGVALNVKRPVIVIDGDGAALMKLGALATIGAHAPDNLVHLILDNGVHDSTGGQATVSPGVSFAGAARACGYRSSHVCDSLDGFAAAIGDGLAGAKPCLIHMRTAPGSLSPLGRPTLAPYEVARRFQGFLAS